MSISLLVVLGSGGHTAEMLRLMTILETNHFTKIHFIVAKSDQHSYIKVSNWLKTTSFTGVFHYITRSREVGQSWISSFVSCLYAIFESIFLCIQINPHLILTNGPGTCLPIIYLSYILKLFGNVNRIVYIESFARVNTLSLTGRLVYPVVDRFIVQWPMKNWPNAECVGKLY